MLASVHENKDCLLFGITPATSVLIALRLPLGEMKAVLQKRLVIISC